MSIAASSADRKAERSFGAKGGGPEVISPKDRRCSIRPRVASADPIIAALGEPIATGWFVQGNIGVDGAMVCRNTKNVFQVA